MKQATHSLQHNIRSVHDIRSEEGKQEHQADCSQDDAAGPHIRHSPVIVLLVGAQHHLRRQILYCSLG